MTRRLGSLGAALGALAVAAGAFGAHGLQDVVSARMLDIWGTASRYHLFHAIALILAWGVWRRTESRAARWAAWSLLVGTLIFSGTLYALVLLDAPWLGAVTPVGGATLIVGWCAFAVALWPGGSGEG